MESTQITKKEYHESDGTKVIETITIRKIRPTTTTTTTTNNNNNNNKSIINKLITKTNNLILNNNNNDNNNEKNYDSKQFEKDSLDRHNYYRRKHGCEPLTLSKDLCQYAQEWANQLARKNCIQHRTEQKYGENIYMKGGTNVSIHGNDAVDAWYDEIKKYNFNSPGFKSGIGHFTQVVWRDSKKLGIAYAKKGTSIYVVANYDPPGNYQGQFDKNVPKPK